MDGSFRCGSSVRCKGRVDGVVLTQGIALPVLGEQDPPEVGMTLEPNAEHVVALGSRVIPTSGGSCSPRTGRAIPCVRTTPSTRPLHRTDDPQRKEPSMIHELRTYTLVPGKQGEYLKLNAEVGRPTRGDKYGKLEGSWTTEFGTLNQFVHLWSYPDLVERERLRAELMKNDAWTKEYIPKIRPLLVAQENKILSAQLPLRPPVDGGHIYELRTYRTQVGKAGEWLGHLKTNMPVRGEESQNVGLWQTEGSQLNEGVHLWAYRDLNHRAEGRANALKDSDWQIGRASCRERV